MNKKLVITGMAMVIFGLSATAVFAVDDFGINGLVNDTQKMLNQSSHSAVKKEEDLASVIAKADKMIIGRVNDLNNLSKRISDDKHLTAAEQAPLLADIQTNITGLNQLKLKIDADTNLTDARADMKQVITSYQVYAYFLPKIRLLISIDNMQTLVDNLQTLTPKLQTLITTLQGQGKNVSAAQPLVDDVNTQLKTASATLTSSKATLLALTATSDSKSSLNQVYQNLSGIKKNLAQVRTDLGQMRQIFSVAITGKTDNHEATHSSTPVRPGSTPIQSGSIPNFRNNSEHHDSSTGSANFQQ